MSISLFMKRIEVRCIPSNLRREMHERLVTIHPFIDGNGRTARLVMNLILLQHGYPITVISSDRKRRAQYYTTLEAAQISDPRDNTEFKVLIAETTKEWCIRYLNMLAPSIDDEAQRQGLLLFQKDRALSQRRLILFFLV